MDLFFLSAPQPLTKTYAKQVDGSITKTSYPDVYRVTSHRETVSSLDDFHAAIQHHANLGHCLVKGQLHRDLVSESRAGATISADATQWICLDIDGLPTLQTIDQVLKDLEITNTDYIVQWSASQGIDASGLRCHIFLMLGKPVLAPVLKQWLIQLNLTTSLLSSNMSLARNGNTVRWALDITTCQNDKLIFIAPPVLKKLRDPLKGQPRYQLVKRGLPTFNLPTKLALAATNAHGTATRLQELRKNAGLPARKFTTKFHNDTEVLAKPDQATVTVDRVTEKFTYLNLNSGDSAAYWHPNDDAGVIYNFKGEPNYLTKELDPDYWKVASTAAKLTSQQETDVIETGASTPASALDVIHLAFRDRQSDCYYNGTYSPETEELDLVRTSSEKKLRDYCMQFNVPIGELVQIWDMVFDPQDTIRLDVANKTINMFHRTQYMRTEPKTVRVCPPTIFKVINHALGAEPAIVEHFMNWLAFIVQQRTRTNTAWVLYGTEGTGKGLLIDYILRPMLGMKQTSKLRASQLDEKYNGFMRNTLLVFYDEAQIPNMRNPESVMEMLRNFITEDSITVREMYSGSVETPNYSNHILASNKPNAILLNNNDRRWNVGKFQHDKLNTDPKHGGVDVEKQIVSGCELQNFYHYLYGYAVDERAARTPLDTGDRQALIDTTVSSADEVAQALNADSADMGFFLDQLPTDNSYLADAQRMNKVEDYRAILLVLLERTTPDGKCKITRDELFGLFEYPVGSIPSTPNKFTKYLKHRHIHVAPMALDARTVRGAQVTWADAKNFPTYLADHWPTKKTKEKS